MKSGKKEGVAEMGRKGRRKEEGGGKREREDSCLSSALDLTLQCEHVTAGAVATILCLKGQVKRIKETQAWLPELT